MGKPKSSSLFHFTKSIESLCGILKNGFYPRYSFEDLRWLDPALGTVGRPIVCFCDIPLGRISDHVAYYGSYGIGLTRRWGISRGLNPLMYVSPISAFADDFHHIYHGLLGSKSKKSQDHFGAMVSLAVFVKRLTGKVIVNGKAMSKEFYQESEWRHSARDGVIDPFIFPGEGASKKRMANDLAAKRCPLMFRPGDVRYIFVKTDSEIPTVLNFINNELDRFPSNDIKVLTTRITSLESLDPDL
jgi:hypothetical protein